MRYFSITICASSSEIEEKSKVKIRKYAFDNPVEAVNSYMYETLENGFSFIIYKEECGKMNAAYSYDDNTKSPEDVRAYIAGMLKEAFLIENISNEPVEVTMRQFMEYALEGKRRENISMLLKIVSASGLWIYDYFQIEKQPTAFDFDEMIIPESKSDINRMYSESFAREIANIKANKNPLDFAGNMVHYVISSRSMEAAKDMIETLACSLAKANRIHSHRIEIISQINPAVFSHDFCLERIIENNRGGILVIDLKEKFGCNAVDYGMTCKYLEKVLKQYRNQCLFIFRYDIDNPGFSYYLLPNLKKYVIPVMVNEGKGTREDALSYLKELISSSRYREYSNQADEFMRDLKMKEYTQSSVLEAFERFEAWCLGKNILNAYGYSLEDDFVLDREESEDDASKKLESLIGLEAVKRKLKSILTADLVEKERRKRRGCDYKQSSMHMIFSGNPGSAKTTVAKLFGRIAKEKGVLRSGAFVETGGMDLDGLGCTIRIREAFLAAKGGVLFIDEAYSLKSESAITALIQEMETQRENVIVILAGYDEKMKEFLELNEGLKSRIPYWIEFPDYTTAELTEIFKMMLSERGFEATDSAIKEASYIFNRSRLIDNFGNGRYVRNLIERGIENQSARLMSGNESLDNIENEDLFILTELDISEAAENTDARRAAGTAQKELDEMIGLKPVKEVLRKAVSARKLNKLLAERGIEREPYSMHMAFTGNPGTAKTTVARLLAEIMRDENLLSTGAFVEVGRAELVGEHVGATAPLVKKRFKEAQGGVLFIDEAYSLCDGYRSGYGDEAITTIVQEMENHKDNVIVIFAGYPKPMSEFLDRNPGMKSRVAFHIDFPDYTADELCDIAKLMLKKRQLSISDEAAGRLRDLMAKAVGSSDFGNGRYVRKLLSEAEMMHADRLMMQGISKCSQEQLTCIEACDIPESQKGSKPETRQIGFVVA